ncbi:MAG: prokaryotic E2 ligase family D protein [Chloroflexi bacterium]|nr:prokaryotic E2 ligase family D protein [Chloroflexota bacterium]
MLPSIDYLLVAVRLGELYEVIFPQFPAHLEEVVAWQNEEAVAKVVERFLSYVADLSLSKMNVGKWKWRLLPGVCMPFRWYLRASIYPVAVQDVVSACTEITLGSGFLPPNTLFWKQKALGLYIPARRWQVRTEKKPHHVPMPPLVFVGQGRAYSIYAVKKRPLSAQTPLYHLPAPNVFKDGGICQGNTPSLIVPH